MTTGENSYRPGDGHAQDASASEKLNAALPYWIRFSGEIRERFEGYSNSGFKPNSSDDYVLDRMRLGLLLRPTKWLNFFGEMQDARVWGKSPAIPPYQNTFDLRQAYVELKSPTENGFSLKVGRQEFNYGNGRLLGMSWWTNVSRSFDAVRASYKVGKLTVDAFASSVVIVRDGVIDHHNQGNNLHGLYGVVRDLIPHSTLDVYELWHLQHGVSTEEGKPGHLGQYTTGFRWVGKLPLNFDYRTEMMLQRGMIGIEHIQAWSGHWVGGYSVPSLSLKPRAFVEYDYASGDKANKDGYSNTFDPIYPSTHDKLGLADQIGWKNIRDLRFGLEARPGKKWAVGTSIHDYWLANAHDALYPTRGSIIARSIKGTAGTHVGEELDVQAIYKLTPQTQLGAGYGHFFTGHFLNVLTKGKDYNAPYILAEYVF